MQPLSTPPIHKRRWITLSIMTACLVVLAGAVWLERKPLLAWYCVRNLKQAGPGERDVWVERVAELDGAALADLYEGLGRNDAMTCENMAAALARVVEQWEAQDPRRTEVAQELLERFPRLCPAGQQAVLKMETAWLRPDATAPLPTTVASAAAQRLPQAAKSSDAGTHAQALALAAVLLRRPDHAELQGDCRDLVQVCLHDAEPDNRLHAIPLAQQPGIGLLDQVLGLLSDPSAEVRRAAMLACRQAPEALMKTETLLRWLHDPDEDVRRLCEAVLRGRNLTEEQLRLGRLLTDDRPSVRLQVLNYLHVDSDLEPGVWLRLLSIDPEPAVRVAAMRAAAADPRVDLSDRLDQMTQRDPSPTVSQLARYYLSCQQHKSATPER
jgi:hypothetical protein